VFSAWSVAEAASFGENLAAGMEALESALFTSKVLLLRLPEDMERDEDLERIIQSAREYELGVLLCTAQEEPAGGGPVVVWVSRPRQGWKVGPELGNMDLALLAGYKLAANRGQELVVVAARAAEPDREEEARGFWDAVLELARMPDARMEAAAKGREQELAARLRPWLCLAPLEPEADLDEVRDLARRQGAPCLMAMDSQKENAPAQPLGAVGPRPADRRSLARQDGWAFPALAGAGPPVRQRTGGPGGGWAVSRPAPPGRCARLSSGQCCASTPGPAAAPAR
jgi:hypothetical protein